MKRSVPLMRSLMLAGIAVAFALGYLAARNSAGTGKSDGGSQKVARSGSESVSGERGTRQVTEVGSWREARERLVKRWESSPDATSDFELREETRRLLERIPVADLEAWLREPLADFEGDEDQDIPLQLRGMVLKLLAPRGAGSLIRSLAEHPLEEKDYVLDEAMDHWTRQDPAAVLVWMDGEIPEAIKEDIGDYREDALVELAGKNPHEFEKRLAAVDADTREDVLEKFAERRGNAEDRAAILERAARSPHGEAMALWRGLIRSEGSDHPGRAFAKLAELEISDADRATLDQGLVEWLLGGFFNGFSTREEDLTWVIQGWVERNSGQPVPAGLLDSFQKWSRRSAEHAMIWVADQPSGPQYDAFAPVLIGQRVGDDEKTLPSFAGLAARIADPAIRGAGHRRLKESWQPADPAAATEWERNLSPEDRERMK